MVVRKIREATSKIPLRDTRTRTHDQRRTIREKDPYQLFAVGELLGPACEFPLVYIESNRGSSHVSESEERSVTDTHVDTRGEKRDISSRAKEKHRKNTSNRRLIC